MTTDHAAHDQLDQHHSLTPANLVDACATGLRRARDAIELEQASHGLDSWSELDLQGVLAEALGDAGFGVAREQRYPGDRQKRQRTSGRRCDLVVTAGGPLLLEHAQPDLFASGPTRSSAEAAWIEVKVLKQFRPGGPNRSWSRGLLRPPTVDIARLAGDPGLGLRGLVMLLFTASREVAEHDLGVWCDHVVADAGLPLGDALVRHLPLVDRCGNALCTTAWVTVMAT